MPGPTRRGRQDEYRSWRVLCTTARLIVSLCLVLLGNNTLELRSTAAGFYRKVRRDSQPRAHIFRSVSAKRTSFPLHTRASRFTRWGMRFPSECPHSVLEPRGRTIPSPSARNATAKPGSECPLPIACYLPPGACTLTHASANSLIRTQRTSKKHRCWIVAQRRVSCRWSTPQRKAERIPAARVQEMTRTRH